MHFEAVFGICPAFWDASAGQDFVLPCPAPSCSVLLKQDTSRTENFNSQIYNHLTNYLIFLNIISSNILLKIVYFFILCYYAIIQ